MSSAKQSITESDLKLKKAEILPAKQTAIEVVAKFSYMAINYFGLLTASPQTLISLLQQPQKMQIIIVLNGYRQNLLHEACKNNIFEVIKPLIKCGCNPAKQDLNGRTPLHIALEREHFECIGEFINLMQDIRSNNSINPTTNPSSNPNTSNEVNIVLENLKKMLEAYDDIGHTIIHAVVLENLPKILEPLLQFCLEFDVKILENEVLGCGNSLLHLAVKNRAVNMQRLIIKYLPESLNVRNYAGALALDIDEISKKLETKLGSPQNCHKTRQHRKHKNKKLTTNRMSQCKNKLTMTE